MHCLHFMAVLPADTRVDVSYLKTAIIGGIMAGVGIGMVLRTEITTGERICWRV